MPFVQAKCPECGGMLAVDDSKKAAVCQFCGEAFIVQEAVNNYNTYNTYNTNNTTNHNYGEGAVVNVYEDINKDFVIEGGVLKKYMGTSLTPVIPEGVVSIDPAVFSRCAITKVTFPSTLRSIRSKYEVDRVLGKIFYYGSFEGCCYLEEVILPEGLLDIGAGAFSGCSSLKSIIIPASVTSIGNEAFAGCKNLSPVDIPQTVKYIGNDVFKGIPYYDKKKTQSENITKLNNLNKESFETPSQLSALGQRYKELDDAPAKAFGEKCMLVASQWQEYENTKKEYDEWLSATPAFFAFKGPMIIVGIVTLLNGFVVWFLVMLLEYIIRKSKANKIKKSDNYLSDMRILKNRKEKIDGILEMIRMRDISGVNNSADLIKEDLKLSCVVKKDILRSFAESYEKKHG